MTMHDLPDAADADEAAPDADLVLRSRSGDVAAFGELWTRHYRSGIVVARSVTSSIDPDDLVQEAYARIFQAIQKGGGPSGSFRAYLFTSIRNTAAAWGRASKESAIDELDAVEDPESTEEATLAALDRSLTTTAFRSLPTRWQEVLWYTEIEQLKPAQVAPLLGMKPVAVAQLAFRAREGLREAWIQAHLNAVADGSDCQWTIEHLGAHTRGNLGARNRQRLDDHLRDCARCTIIAGEAQEVGSRLALVLLPITIGVSATAAYLASLQRDDAAAVALAAMPSGLVEGAVVAAGGAGVAAGGAGVAASGAAGGPGSSPGGSSTFTLGGLIAAGVLAVAVAAAAVAGSLGFLPGGASEAFSQSASDRAGAPAADVEASQELVDSTQQATDPEASPSPTPTPSPERPATPAPRPTLTPPATIAQVMDRIQVVSARGQSDGSVVMRVVGQPGEAVEVYAIGSDGSGGRGLSSGVPLAVKLASFSALTRTTLDGAGRGTLYFTLSRAQVLDDVTLEVRYVHSTQGIATHPLTGLWSLRDELLPPAPPASPEPTPGPEPTATPEPTPTPEPTVDPTPEPTPEPTAEPTPGPIAEPTPTPSPSPTPTAPSNPVALVDMASYCRVDLLGDDEYVIGFTGPAGADYRIVLDPRANGREQVATGMFPADGTAEVVFTEEGVKHVHQAVVTLTSQGQTVEARLDELITADACSLL
ncbi:sigma-70 family RNA polymerase sigma factor [Microbacterium stercoris]|uniref:Sigma-70 family RNA polymerase sigma factor n=1 Tax=Microbacterium stercoris TaxID=2820289 RepID=A0A939QLX2_9MICO|nr:sigma-70 family RNA polymerase sigma factor [Microbacterium stercoris]MBO3663160.1 sigma-70 family RNA polymerase sigma factor [Microbacterium stercoris]